MATTKNTNTKQTNRLLMEPVDAMPKAGRGRQSMYVEAIDLLAQNPGQVFKVRQCPSAGAAASARGALVKAAKQAGLSIEAQVSGVDLFAVAKTSGKRRSATPS